MSDKLTSEQVIEKARAHVVSRRREWQYYIDAKAVMRDSTCDSHDVSSGALTVGDLDTLLSHIAALEAENARRDQALIEYMGGDGHWQMLNGDSAESILAGFNAAHPTSQTVKDPSHD